MGKVWLTAHVTELRLTAGSGPWNGDEHRPSCCCCCFLLALDQGSYATSLGEASIPLVTSGSLNRKVMGSSSSKWWLRASFSTGHSVIKCTSISSAWAHRFHVAGSGWSWFLVILLQYHANSGVCPYVWRRKSRVFCEGVKSFSWSLFTYVAWGTAGLAILLRLRAQRWRITVLAVLKSTGAAVCGNVEVSFAILSARMLPFILQWPGIHWNIICALAPAAVCSTSESMWCTISFFPFRSTDKAQRAPFPMGALTFYLS